MRILLLSILAFCTVNLYSQSYITNFKYQKVNMQAAAIDLPYSEKITEEALINFMAKKASGKPAESRGVLVFRNTRINEAENADLHVAIERKSRREKDFCTIYMMPARLNENMATRSPDEKFGLEGAQVLLNEFAPAVIAYALELEIQDQQEAVSKATKKFNSLVSDSVNLQKRKVSVEEMIIRNSKDREKQKIEIENQRKMLEALDKKRNPQPKEANKKD